MAYSAKWTAVCHDGPVDLIISREDYLMEWRANLRIPAGEAKKLILSQREFNISEFSTRFSGMAKMNKYTSMDELRLADAECIGNGPVWADGKIFDFVDVDRDQDAIQFSSSDSAGVA